MKKKPDLFKVKTSAIEMYCIRGVTYKITETTRRGDDIYRVLKSVGATGWKFLDGEWETAGGARGGILFHLSKGKK